MNKITIQIECEDADEARSVIDQLTERSAAAPVTKTDDVKTDVKAAELDPDEVVVDSDGMPHDEAVHASSREVNQDGTWKARRGKAKEATAARAAFKAAGGSVDAPVVEEDVKVPGLPGTAEKTATGLPGVDKIPTAQPVTMEDFAAKASAVMESGKINGDELVAMYLEVTDQTDTAAAVKIFETNESMRRAAVERLTEIENG